MIGVFAVPAVEDAELQKRLDMFHAVLWWMFAAGLAVSLPSVLTLGAGVFFAFGLHTVGAVVCLGLLSSRQWDLAEMGYLAVLLGSVILFVLSVVNSFQGVVLAPVMLLATIPVLVAVVLLGRRAWVVGCASGLFVLAGAFGPEAHIEPNLSSTVSLLTALFALGLFAFVRHRTERASTSLRERDAKLRSLEDQAKRASRSRELLLAILHGMRDAVVVTDEVGVVIQANPAFTALVGYPESDILGRPLPKFLGDASALLMGADTEREATLLSAGGPIPLWLSRGTLTNGGGFIWVGSDIRDRKLADSRLRKQELAAREAESAKSIFLANMSHELRTPLSGIMGYADLLLEDQSEDDAFCSDVGRIRTAGEQLLSMIGLVLDLARVDAGKLQVQLELLDFADLLRSCASTTGVPIDLADSPETMVSSDPVYLGIVIRSLFEYAPVEEVIASCRSTRWSVSFVYDLVPLGGVGLSEVFEPFSRRTGARSRQQLQIALGWQLARLLGWRIRVDSTQSARTLVLTQQ